MSSEKVCPYDAETSQGLSSLKLRLKAGSTAHGKVRFNGAWRGEAEYITRLFGRRSRERQPSRCSLDGKPAAAEVSSLECKSSSREVGPPVWLRSAQAWSRAFWVAYMSFREGARPLPPGVASPLCEGCRGVQSAPGGENRVLGVERPPSSSEKCVAGCGGYSISSVRNILSCGYCSGSTAKHELVRLFGLNLKTSYKPLHKTQRHSHVARK